MYYLLYHFLPAFLLFGLTGAALYCDLRTGKIPNALVGAGLAAGLFYQLYLNRLDGFLYFLLGLTIPVLLLWVLFYFRMLGAGDIKLLCAVCAIAGYPGAVKCLIYTFFLGALCSILILIRNRNLGERLSYFHNYITELLETGKYRPYWGTKEKGTYLHFSIPIFLAAIFYIGGF